MPRGTQITSSQLQAPSSELQTPGSRLFLIGLPLAIIWLVVVARFRAEWTLNPQYGYGWSVPILCLGLLLRRWQDRPEPLPPTNYGVPIAAMLILSLSYLPVRIVNEANPVWRLPEWIMALQLVGVSSIAAFLIGGRPWLKHFIFPITLFLVAIPWPSQIENTVIQTLTQWNATAAVECLTWVGIPALQHGNTIEIGTGVVGINEACSGIRSFQASLMIALFLGELLRFNISRRLILLIASIALAVSLNVIRTFTLTNIASKQGIDIIDKWHDPIGWTIMIGCLMGLGLLAVLMRRTDSSDSTFSPSELRNPRFSAAAATIVAASLFLLSEVGNEFWYRSHEHTIPASKDWTIREIPNVDEEEIPNRIAGILKFDEGSAQSWTASDRTKWFLWNFRWHAPNNLYERVNVHSAVAHRPEICLPATGRRLVFRSDLKYTEVDGVVLPYRTYEFAEGDSSLFVFHSISEDKSRLQHAEATMVPTYKYSDRLNAAWEGRRHTGVRVLELAVRKSGDIHSAEVQFLDLIQSIIVTSDRT